MASSEEIAQQQELMTAHRRRLARLLRQQATYGLNVPPQIVNEIEEARGQIRSIEEVLRSWGVEVEDLAGDERSPGSGTMASSEEIAQQQELLDTHRRRLAVLLQQQERFGENVPPHIVIDIEEARDQIRNLKDELRSSGIEVEDLAGDERSPDELYTSRPRAEQSPTLPRSPEVLGEEKPDETGESSTSLPVEKGADQQTSFGGATSSYDVFISYAQPDRTWVEGYLLDALQRAGVRVHSEDAFAVGVPLQLELERAIRQSKRILLVLSPDYLASNFAQFTDVLAQNYGPESGTWPVIPLILHPVELPPPLTQLQALDFTDNQAWPEQLGMLLSSLGASAVRDGQAGPQEKLGDEWMSNDRPTGQDRLGYEAYAAAFARVLSSKYTRPPLTVGVYASWGMGKSFLMSKIRAEMERTLDEHKKGRRARRLSVRLKEWLERRQPARMLAVAGFINPVQGQGVALFQRLAPPLPPTQEIDEFIFIDFNAWVYSGSANLWAGLIARLYSEVEKHFGQWRTAYFRLGKTFRSSFRRTVGLIFIYGLLGAALSILLNYSDLQASFEKLRANLNNVQANWDTVQDAFKTLAGAAAIIGSALAALPALLKSLNELFSSLFQARSEQLRALSSRPDFRDKIGFMADIKDEIGNISELVKRGKRGRPMRLVIFIDDLDRCHPTKAVEVLEAIMLLLADEDGAPFIIFLGLDARIIVKAIEERYGKVLTDAGITGYEYLDKIVQIPFRIPPAPEDTLKRYVASLLWRDEGEQKQVRDAQAQGATGQSASETTPRTASPPTPPPGSQPPPQAKQPPIEVSFTKEEREAFEGFTPFLSPNPRRVKRIVNIYRVVRDITKPPPIEAPKLIKWIVLSEQWPYRIAWMMQRIEDDYQTKRGFEQTRDVGLDKVFETIRPRVEAKEAQVFATLDGDPELFTNFLNMSPTISVADVQIMRPLTFNLNPAIQEEVRRAADTKYEPETAGAPAGNAPPLNGAPPDGSKRAARKTRRKTA